MCLIRRHAAALSRSVRFHVPDRRSARHSAAALASSAADPGEPLVRFELRLWSADPAACLSAAASFLALSASSASTSRPLTPPHPTPASLTIQRASRAVALPSARLRPCACRLRRAQQRKRFSEKKRQVCRHRPFTRDRTRTDAPRRFSAFQFAVQPASCISKKPGSPSARRRLSLPFVAPPSGPSAALFQRRSETIRYISAPQALEDPCLPYRIRLSSMPLLG